MKHRGGEKTSTTTKKKKKTIFDQFTDDIKQISVRVRLDTKKKSKGLMRTMRHVCGMYCPNERDNHIC